MISADQKWPEKKRLLFKSTLTSEQLSPLCSCVLPALFRFASVLRTRTFKNNFVIRKSQIIVDIWMDCAHSPC